MFNINNELSSYGRGYVFPAVSSGMVYKNGKKVLKDGIDTECKEMLMTLQKNINF